MLVSPSITDIIWEDCLGAPELLSAFGWIINKDVQIRAMTNKNLEGKNASNAYSNFLEIDCLC